MPFFHGATEFLYKKLWFIIPKRLVLYFFFLSKSWLICLLQLPILRVQFIAPSLVSLIDFLYFLKQILLEYFELPQGLSHKESICNAGHERSVSESGRSPEKGNGNPLQYSCLGNPMDRGAWQATVHEIPKESDMTKFTKQQTTNNLASIPDHFIYWLHSLRLACFICSSFSFSFAKWNNN